ncbi:restriction endonuclease subunit S [Vibrio cholerae]|nr:restriction endonuclease subunit S [Vibrio cholerae]EJL6575307.1 restriction endonuclease subunit S [Vibrio cholerae]EJL6789089.1 restriction endonuclease subunit S [Vibrio cholerae]
MKVKNSIPTGWRKVTLNEVGTSFNGLTGKKKDDFGNGEPYINYKSVFNNVFIGEDDFSYVKVSKDESQNIVSYGDILITVSSETPEDVGMSSVYLGTKKTYLNSFCFGIKPKQTIDPVFSAYWLRSSIARKSIVRLAQGSTRFNLSKIKFMDIELPLPSLPEQKKIADILSTVDKKIDLIDQKIAETEKLKTGLMQKLFSEGVGVQDENGEWQPHADFETVEGSQIPKGWLKTTLSQVIKVKSGDSLSKKNMEEGCIPVFGGNGISGYHSKPNFNSPQLVIGRVGEYCGAVHITPEKSWITDNALLVTETLINVSFEFLYYLLVSVDLNKYASRNAQPLVSGRTLNLVTIKVPQEAEQYEIVNILSTVDKKLILLNRQMEETRRLKKGLMQKLLTGEWRVPVEETEAA